MTAQQNRLCPSGKHVRFKSGITARCAHRQVPPLRDVFKVNQFHECMQIDKEKVSFSPLRTNVLFTVLNYFVQTSSVRVFILNIKQVCAAGGISA